MAWESPAFKASCFRKHGGSVSAALPHYLPSSQPFMLHTRRLRWHIRGARPLRPPPRHWCRTHRRCTPASTCTRQRRPRRCRCSRHRRSRARSRGKSTRCTRTPASMCSRSCRNSPCTRLRSSPPSAGGTGCRPRSRPRRCGLGCSPCTRPCKRSSGRLHPHRSRIQQLHGLTETKYSKCGVSKMRSRSTAFRASSSSSQI